MAHLGHCPPGRHRSILARLGITLAFKHFEAARIAFQSPVTLSSPNSELRFNQKKDASARGMRAALMEEELDEKSCIISSASAKFLLREARYHCYEQECLAIVQAIKPYRPFLEV